MEALPQLESTRDSKETAQFNIEISKSVKKQFVSFCVENELILKDAGEMALLAFIENFGKGDK